MSEPAPSRSFRVTFEERAAIRALHGKAGWSTEVLAAEYSRHPKTIGRLLKTPNEKRPKLGRPTGSFKVPPEYLVQLDQLIDEEATRDAGELRDLMLAKMPNLKSALKKATLASLHSTVRPIANLNSFIKFISA
eukprot:gnl/Spiro4/29644_TR14539_c0_g1_i1.p1 gnl/Spiro4/29644_TR14539_c0_g1~~gnl/Spiro4/29644_TR14539_c0_g1_i1.p1  ORF type:complete len:150 (+),score=21.43 gnl/Spiro4/29644_TR14539_c0_g1_i1:49-450(+)